MTTAVNTRINEDNRAIYTEQNKTRLREASYIDFVHEKRHMFVWGAGGGGGGGVGSCDVSL